ncbi:MAG TPA: chemotaxis protein CheW, partial [Candidatus Limiplasma sp.]|nr:chemotaxis protein CheW [Candidatus Limiplasma sp.]
MDFERDYILRLIHMLGDLMRRLAERMDDRERGRMLNEAAHRHCGMGLATAESLTTESLCSLLPPMPRFLMAELLSLRAQLGEDPFTADELRLKALRLLASLNGKTQLCALRADTLKQWKQAIYPLLDSADLMACARFFGTAAQYDEMEDALFQALPLETGDAQVREVLEHTKITKLPRTAEYMKGIINLRGAGVPVIDLRLKFGMP